MTDSQSNRLDMYLVVNDFYLANQLVIDSVAARATAFGQVGLNIEAINVQIAGQSANTTGVAQDKAAARNTLDTIGMSLLAPAKAWAINERNNTLIAEFDYSFSELQRIKDDTVQGFCSHRIQLIEDNLPGMADFGVEPPSLLAWQQALDAYVAVLESPREAINSRHLKTENLKTLFKETSDLLRNQTDPLMVPLKTLEPQVYQGYKQARIIINRGGQSSNPNPQPTTATLFGVVTNEVGGMPIEGATVTIISSGSTISSISTNQSGAFRAEGLQPGEYPLQCVADGYNNFSDTILLEANAEFELNIGLQPEV